VPKTVAQYAHRAHSAELRGFNLELAQYWDDVAEEIDRKLVRRPDP